MGLLARFRVGNGFAFSNSDNRIGSVCDAVDCGNKFDFGVFGVALAGLDAIDNNRVWIRNSTIRGRGGSVRCFSRWARRKVEWDRRVGDTKSGADCGIGECIGARYRAVDLETTIGPLDASGRCNGWRCWFLRNWGCLLRRSPRTTSLWKDGMVPKPRRSWAAVHVSGVVDDDASER